MKTIFRITIIVTIVVVAIWANVQVYKYGEAMYNKGFVDAKEYCLQLRKYNYGR